MKYDRLFFDSVLNALDERESNPFIAFYEDYIESEIRPTGAVIAGIAITFQDQIIPALTLAKLLRKGCPHMRIVLGGQMITRCYDSVV